ncbi:MAG: exported protein of unknown function [Candidatus Eremiobacteraeota bacterium]|nr:exported protein of unknown function [Candidatus Eremiobacteraeota bacterium]
MRNTGMRLATIVIAMMALVPACARYTEKTSVVPSRVALPTALSVSPASVQAPPMARTAALPASAMMALRPPYAMTSGRTAKSAIAALNWAQLPGGAVFVAASPNGSIWALSNQGGGPDRAIWHYVGGGWINIPGAATRLAVAPDGTAWAVNAAGGIYRLDGGSWTSIAGGATDISVGADGTAYAISNQPGNQYGRGIWHYVSGTWSQLPGAAVRVSASWDNGSYPGNIGAAGVWVASSQGVVYYYNPNSGFTLFSGAAAELSATTNGVLFALGHDAGPDGNYPIYYANLSTGGWTREPGAAVSISTNTANVYAAGAAGDIYVAPVASPGPTITPTPTPTPTMSPSPGSGFMDAPLHCSDPNCNKRWDQGPYTSSIMTSVVDHSLRMNANGLYQYGTLATDGSGGGDGVVLAFNGEKANGTPLSSDRTCIGGTIHLAPAPGVTDMVIQNSGCPTGYASYDEHPGYDYRAALNTPVYAAADGVVINNTRDGGTMCVATNIKSCATFNYIGIDHGNGYISQYGHLSSFTVTSGRVVRGQQIGLSGSTGVSAAHLHFEVIKLMPGLPNNYNPYNYAVVDPYGWVGGGTDPLATTFGVPAMKLWR